MLLDRFVTALGEKLDVSGDQVKADFANAIPDFNSVDELSLATVTGLRAKGIDIPIPEVRNDK